MKIQQLFNTNKKEIESKKFNIFIPICLGNKFFTKNNSINKENMDKYLNWALKHTKDKIIVIIADKIQITNYNVRNHNTPGYNERRVLRDGNKLKEEMEELIKKLPNITRNKIQVIQWEDCEEKDPYCNDMTKLVHKEFETNSKFKEEILKVIKTSVTDRPFSEKKYLELCNYVLDEFSIAYSGLTYGGVYYGVYLYPDSDSTVYFLAQLQKGEIFPQLNKKLPKEKVALVILN